MYTDNIGPIIHNNQFLRSELTNRRGNLNLMHFNSQSLSINPASTKLMEIKNIVEESFIDTVGISETWMKPSTPSESVNVSGYSFCRNDRPNMRGGGVGLLVSKKLSHKVVYSGRDYGNVECLFIEVVTDTGKVLVGVVYLPHGNFGAFESEIADLLVYYNDVVIMGDFNKNLFDILNAMSVRQSCSRLGVSIIHNSCPTHFDAFHQSTSLIDFFLSSSPDQVEHSGQFICPSISKHAFIFISLDILPQRCNEFYEYYDYNNYDMEVLQRKFIAADFGRIHYESDVNLQMSIFTRGLGMLHTAFQKKVNLIRYTSDNWLCSPVIRYHQSMCDLAYREFLRDRSDLNWRTYCRLRNRCKRIKRNIKKSVHFRLFNKGSSPRDLWKVIRDNGLGLRNEINYLSVSSAYLNDMNSSFVNSQSDTTGSVEDFLHSFGNEYGFSFSNITLSELYTGFYSVKSNAAGSDGFSMKFLRTVFDMVSPFLLHIVNQIITTSTFPIVWKTAKINPIKKKDSSDFRPIALLPVLSKTVEHVLKQQMISYLENSSLVHDCQCGFRNGRSTAMLLAGLTDSVRKCISEGNIGVLVSLDLEKAFDRVDYFGLINKLSSKFGFSRSACRLIYSYLIDRDQFVHVRGVSSITMSVRSGVPQGSVLGPLLFILFINNLFENLSTWCTPFAYADDVQLIFKGANRFINVLQSKIDLALRSLGTWMSLNKFSINASKTKALLFSRGDVTNLRVCYNGIDIQFVSSLKCLGVILDDKLSFDLHVDSVVSRTTVGLRQLYNTDLVLPCYVRERLAHALIMPNILYCLEIYSGTSRRNLERIHLAINRVVRFSAYNIILQDIPQSYSDFYR
ncbi:uncharacterized protein LOC142235883 [Haematobia irritans]|uniref:uncharacterized protein LOC142235883 n=1 Tax=Haematobia irritans TaxID=7368 RepID=UPI003F4FC328